MLQEMMPSFRFLQLNLTFYVIFSFFDNHLVNKIDTTLWNS